MAFFLAEQSEKVEYVYPFVCGLCEFSTGNIDVFHHHFETHADNVPSSVFHLCELEFMRDDEAAAELNIGSFCCKTCNHTFSTVCNLVKHLDDDSNTDKYIMDLQTKTAYPLTGQCASVLSHTFIGANDKRGEKVVSRNHRSGKWSSVSTSARHTSPKRKGKPAQARSRSGKTGPKRKSSDQSFNNFPFEKLLKKAQSQQKVAYDIFNSMDDLDYDDDDADDFNDNSNEVELAENIVNEETVASEENKSQHWINCKYCGLSFRKRQKRRRQMHEEEHLTYEGNLKHTTESLCKCEGCGCVMKRINSHLHMCPANPMLRKRRPRAKPGEPKKSLDHRLTPCPHCDKTFKRYFLSTHVLQVHVVHDPVPCQICGKILKSKYALTSHIANVHKNNRKFKCDICGYGFLTRSKLKRHLVKHGDVRNFQCDLCPNRYKDSGTLKKHKERVHDTSTESLVFQCELCPKHYGYKDGLSQHQRLVHDIRARPVDPNKAKKRKVSKEKQENYYCDKCGKKFLVQSALTQHLKTHDEYSDKIPHVCDECPEKYYTRQGLRRHKKRKHSALSDAVVYNCDQCPKVFGHPESLRKHQKLYHNPEDNWHVCGWKKCRHKFRTESELEDHRTVHKGAAEVKCDQCDNTYMTREGLMQHKRNIHKQGAGRSETGNAGLSSDVSTQISEEAVQQGLEEARQIRRSSLDMYPQNVQEMVKIEEAVMGNIVEVRTSAELFVASGLIESEHEYAADENDQIKKPKVPKKKQANYNCDICEKKFLLQSALTQHLKTHEAANGGRSSDINTQSFEGTVQINPCSGADTSMQALEGAGQILEGPGSLDVYSQSVQAIVKIENEDTALDQLEQNYNASDEIFSASRLTDSGDEYAADENDTEVFRCDKCPKVYKWMVSLKKHIKTSHNPAYIRFSCTFGACRKKFETLELLSKHSALHKSFDCKKCSKKKMTLKGLRQHMNELHREARPPAPGNKNAGKFAEPKVYIVDINRCAHLVSDNKHHNDSAEKIFSSIRESEGGKIAKNNENTPQGVTSNKKETPGDVKRKNPENTLTGTSKENMLTTNSRPLTVFSNQGQLSDADSEILKEKLQKLDRIKNVQVTSTADSSMQGTSSADSSAINSVETSLRTSQKSGNENPGSVMPKPSNDTITSSPKQKMIVIKKVVKRNCSEKGNDATKTEVSLSHRPKVIKITRLKP